MESSTWRLMAFVGSGTLAIVALGSSASAGIVEVDPTYFGGSATVITFSEVAEGTEIPFSIGIADFSGSGGLTYSYGPADPYAPPAPSDSPFLYSGSVGMDDWIEVVLGAPQEAVGAYFNTAGSKFFGGVLQLELYSGDTLLGIVDATYDENWGGFIGASAGETIIDRVIFRDIDETIGISFRIDDFQFVPAPGGVLVLACAALARRRRR